MRISVVVSFKIGFSSSLIREDCPQLSEFSNAIPLARRPLFLHRFLVVAATIVCSHSFHIIDAE